MPTKRFILYFISPLLWYLAFTIGVPLINNYLSGYQTGFFEHVITVIFVSGIITGLMVLLLRRKEENLSASKHDSDIKNKKT